MEHRIYTTELAGQTLYIEVGSWQNRPITPAQSIWRYNGFVAVTASDTPREGSISSFSVDFEENSMQWDGFQEDLLKEGRYRKGY